MTEAASLFVSIHGRDVSADALLRRLEARLRETDAAGLRTAGVFAGALPAAQQRSISSTLALAQANARLAVAQGDPARGAQILGQALAQQTRQTVQTINAERQLIAIQNRVSGSTRSLASEMGGLRGSLSALQGGIQALGIGFGLQQMLQFQGAALSAANSLEKTQATVRALSGSQERYNEVLAIAKEGQKLYGGSLEKNLGGLGTLVNLSNTAGVSLSQLDNIARRLAIVDPMQGIEGANAALKEFASGNIGTLATRFELSRSALRALNDESLSMAERFNALDKALTEMGISSDVLTNATKTNAAAFDTLAAAGDKIKTKLGSELAADLAPTASALSRIVDALDRLQGASSAADPRIAALRQEFIESAPLVGPFAQGIRQLADDLDRLIPPTVKVATVTQQNATAFASRAQQMRLASAATKEDTSTLEASAAQTELLTAQKALLTAETNAAVDAFLALNPNMTASAAAAAAGAAGLPPFIAKMIELTLRAREARNALASFNALQGVKALRAPAAGEAESEVRGFARGVRADELKKQTDAAHAAAAAEREYQKTLGNTGPALERANRELANIPEGTEAYYDKLTEIQSLKERQLAAGRKAAGAAQLSDQQRLNNTLLADQDKAADQAAAAARAHGQKILDIERDFLKRSMEQQRANEVSKRAGEIDFLKSLTGSELNATKEGRAAIQAINERFYADFQAAQEAAQAGNAKQSEEMVAQAKRRADVELQYAEQIDAARQAKNQSEITRLTALREMERQLLDEQAKQLAAAGDPNVNARKEALDEEERNFAEQQGKIGDAADAAAQRKIDAALRSGKAIDAENLRLQQQEEILNRIAARTGAPGAGGGGGGTGAAPAASPGAPAITTPEPAGANLGMVVKAIDALLPALQEVKSAIEKDTRETTREIRRIGSERFVY